MSCMLKCWLLCLTAVPTWSLVGSLVSCCLTVGTLLVIDVLTGLLLSVMT